MPEKRTGNPYHPTCSKRFLSTKIILQNVAIGQVKLNQNNIAPSVLLYIWNGKLSYYYVDDFGRENLGNSDYHQNLIGCYPCQHFG